MVQEQETQVSQGDPGEVQEPASQTLEERVLEPASQAEGEAQEPSVAVLLAERDALQKRLRDAEADAAGTKSAYQRDIAAANKKWADFERQREAGQTQAERKYWEAKRDSEDPTERDEYLDHERGLQATFATQQAARQENINRTWTALVSNPRFDSLTVAEKTVIDQGLRDKYVNSPTLMRDGDFNADLAGELAAAVDAKSNNALAEEVKTMREELAALKAARAGSNLRDHGGPERPLEGGGGSRSISTLEEAEAAHVRGEINNEQMRQYRRTLQYAGGR